MSNLDFDARLAKGHWVCQKCKEVRWGQFESAAVRARYERQAREDQDCTFAAAHATASSTTRQAEISLGLSMMQENWKREQSRSPGILKFLSGIVRSGAEGRTHVAAAVPCQWTLVKLQSQTRSPCWLGCRLFTKRRLEAPPDCAGKSSLHLFSNLVLKAAKRLTVYARRYNHFSCHKLITYEEKTAILTQRNGTKEWEKKAFCTQK
jgi:hypothetical protein